MQIVGIDRFLQDTTHGRTAFFTGAGISHSAGVPLARELVDVLTFARMLEDILESNGPRGPEDSRLYKELDGLHRATCGCQQPPLSYLRSALEWYPNRNRYPAFEKRLWEYERKAEPENPEPKDYATAFKDYFNKVRDPGESHRHVFARDLVAPHKMPGPEHLLLADLADTTYRRDRLRWDFDFWKLSPDRFAPNLPTLNFDQLLERALVQLGSAPSPNGGDTAHCLDPQTTIPQVWHAHGGMGVLTVNTDSEMNSAGPRIAELDRLLEGNGALHVVILGYGGCCDDVFWKWLESHVTDHRLFVWWSCYPSQEPSPVVVGLLQRMEPRAFLLAPGMTAAHVLQLIWEGVRQWPVTSLYRQHLYGIRHTRWAGRGITIELDAVMEQGQRDWPKLSALSQAEIRVVSLRGESEKMERLRLRERSAVRTWVAQASDELQGMASSLGNRRYAKYVRALRSWTVWRFSDNPSLEDVKQLIRFAWEASDDDFFSGVVREVRSELGRLGEGDDRRKQLASELVTLLQDRSLRVSATVFGV